MAGEFEACSLQECENVHCFKDVGAVSENECLAVAKDAESIIEEESEESEVKNGLERGGYGELGALHSEFAEDVSEGFGGFSRRLGKEKWTGGRLVCSLEGGDCWRCRIFDRSLRS